MILLRGIPVPMLAAMDQTSYPVLFAFIDWPSAPARVHSGIGIITWGGHDWQGVGNLGNVEIPGEYIGVSADEATFSLAGVSADLDGYADDAIRGRLTTLHYGCLTDRPGGYNGKQTDTLVSDPVLLFTGLMDAMAITDTATETGIRHELKLQVATGVEARAGATIFHSDGDQRRHFPFDTAGRLVILAYAKAQKLRWPADD